MLKQVTKETYRYMWRNKKNRLFIGLAFAFVFVYVVLLLPRIPGPGEVDIGDLEREMYANQQQFEDRLESGMTAPSGMTGTNVYEVAHNEFVAQRELLTALRQGDIYRYLEIPYRPETDEGNVGSVGHSFGDFDFSIMGTPLEEPFRSQKYQFYAQEVSDLSFHTVHNRTSTQQLYLFLLGLGPVILLLSSVFLLSDTLVKDRQLKTQKIGQPSHWQTYLYVQSMASLSFVLLFFLALGLFFVGLNSLLHGFGSLALPIGYVEAIFESGQGEVIRLELRSVGWFLGRVLPYGFLLFYLIARLNVLFSLVLKHPVVVMVAGFFIILFQQLYYGEETSELVGVHLSWYPQTYINIGEVLTGHMEVQWQEAIPDFMQRGWLVLGVSVFVLEILLYGVSKKVTRQKFVR